MLGLIPISDANPTRRTPVVTLTLIVVNVIAFFFVEPGFGTSGEAQVFFLAHGGPELDPHGLDRDVNGRACESLP